MDYELADGDATMHRIALEEDEETEFVPVTQPAVQVDQSIYIAFAEGNVPDPSIKAGVLYRLVEQ